VLSLDTGRYHTVIEQGYHARYVPTGHVAFMRAGTLMAVPFDVGQLKTTGPAVPLVDGISARHSTEASFAVSASGFLIYAPGPVAGRDMHTLVWVDRQGREELITAQRRRYISPRLSPDETRIALDIGDQDNDIWIWSFARQNLSRITFDPRSDIAPIWTPDGKRIVFSSRRDLTQNLAWQAADGTGTVEQLSESGNHQLASDISRDGKLVIFSEAPTPIRSADVQMLSLEDRRVVPLLRGEQNERNGVLSPNGRWLAYESDESSRVFEIFVRSFPDINSFRVQVSAGGGSRPLWSRDGSELFYLAGFSPGPVRMMTTKVQSGTDFVAGSPQQIFEGRYLASEIFPFPRPYDVSANGRRFVMIKGPPTDQRATPSPPFVVVLNWTEELKHLVPVN
jgi:serine/threonine-protein kinase